MVNHVKSEEKLPMEWFKFELILIARFMGANMGPIWGRQDPGGPHVGPMNFAIWNIMQPPTNFRSCFKSPIY